MLHNQVFKRYVNILFLLFISFNTFAQKAYTIAEIPDPKKNGGGWISDPDKILSTEDIETVNSTISSFESKTHVQVAVVLVNNFAQNKEDFDFAYELFNNWGIGSKTSNNGLLLFISKTRRKYRFITGTGIEGVLPDVKLKHIAEQNLIPAFRKNDFGAGIINTINAVGIIVLNPENKSELNQAFTQPENNSPLEKLWFPTIGIIVTFFGVFKIVNRQAKKLIKNEAKPKNKEDYDPSLIKGCGITLLIAFFSIFVLVFFNGFGLLEKIKLEHIPIILFITLALILYFRYLFLVSALRNAYKDDENFLDAVNTFNKSNWWLILFSPLILISLIRQKSNNAKASERFQPVLDSKENKMIRVDRDENVDGVPYLTPGQRKEETIKALDYDIWLSTDGKEHVIKAWRAEKYTGYSECPSCGFRAYKMDKQVTIKAATYRNEGQAKIINECSFCKKTEFIKSITLAMLVRSNSSSGSSSSGSSSSSSSSWGGGSSSGGGTGGSW